METAKALALAGYDIVFVDRPVRRLLFVGRHGSVTTIL